ncbi:MAG: DUF3244 domain-containing protein [Bacteroidetes bacterium]|uniref:DUF3244 domain-containing protein n=1 Tax=Candidatus Cryptobacteroides faecavium TaxID=2840762 RepID=A0A9D9IDB6_9BACT|nr:DUF3244 domain-containing protein [Candidatus Cryptobacteroides faecavium]
MKKILLFSVALLLLLPVQNITADDDNKTVVLNIDIYKTAKQLQRSFVDIPIECYYVGFDSSVVIVFSEDIGTVDISIVNTSTGEVFFDTVDAKDGQYAVGISGDDGTYILQIGTESGDIYEGEFTLN